MFVRIGLAGKNNRWRILVGESGAMRQKANIASDVSEVGRYCGWCFGRGVIVHLEGIDSYIVLFHVTFYSLILAVVKCGHAVLTPSRILVEQIDASDMEMELV